MAHQIQFKGMYHINFSTANYDTKFVDRDKMIKACDAWKPNLTIIYTEKNTLGNHQVFKYSMFSAPGDILGHFATFEG